MRKMQTMIALFGMTSSLLAGGNAELITVASETRVKPHQKLKLDLYLYNPNSKRITAPSMEFVSARLWVTRTGGSSGEAEVQGQTSTHPPSGQNLGPKQIQHRTTEVQINADKGDLIEISLEIGDKKKLKSNSILLFCSDAKAKNQ